MLKNKIAALAVAPLALAGLAVTAAPAHAADPTQDFMVCVDGGAAGCRPVSYTAGTITWKTVGNPLVSGKVYKAASTYAVKATFIAYYNNTVVDTQPRSVTGTSTERGFNIEDFGQTYRVTKIKVQVCYYASRTATGECEDETYNRIGS